MNENAPVLDLGRLPIPGPHFVGREAELARLDAAWEDPRIHVLTLVAFGGVGKSALVARWLDRMAADGWRGAARVLDWSFYSQGTKDRVTSAEPFIDHALRFFGDPDPKAGSLHDRGARLAYLIRKERSLLVLDGIEPLQYPPGRPEIEGRLKDPGLAALLKGLAAGNPGLCVVTTRERIADLAGSPSTAPQIPLEELEPGAAVDLLRQLGVDGRESELRAAAEEFQRHALTLTLLGNFLRRAHGGDVRKRREIDLHRADEKQGGHAFRVIAAYARWLGEGPELAILRLLGLFDRPAEAGALKALRAAPPIPGLTEPAGGPLGRRLAARRRHPAGPQPAGGGRSAGAGDPRRPSPGARLLRGRAREPPPRRLAGRQPPPLRAPAPGSAGPPRHPGSDATPLRRRRPRLPGGAAAGGDGRGLLAADPAGERVLSVARKLGAFGSELTALAGFFDRPWSQPSARLTAADQAFVLNEAAFDLRALGRLAEAVEPMQAGLEARIAQEDWKNAAAVASNLSELTLTLGDVPRAVAFGEQSVELADRSGDAFQRMSKRTTWADALHQAGRWEESAAAFREAEAMQAERQPEYPRLYSLRGFRYCDLLLGRAEPEAGSGLDGLAGPGSRPEEAERFRQACREVLERAKADAEVSRKANHWLLDIALDHLTLGRAHLGLGPDGPPGRTAPPGSPKPPSTWTGRWTACGGPAHEDHLPRGLLARAALRRFRSDFTGAAADLTEALEIAERGPMRLHECDAHLEWARLCRDQGDLAAARRHVARARELVNETGYGRREREVRWLEGELAKQEDGKKPAPASEATTMTILARRFRVALSFPGEHRSCVEQVAEHLSAAVGRDGVLYDKFYEAEFARMDLDVYLPRLYREQSELIVLFLCPEYRTKRWCQLEWRHIRQLIATVDASRIMLLSFGRAGDLSELGILPGDGYIDIAGRPASEIAGLILQRLNGVTSAPADPGSPSPASPSSGGGRPRNRGALALWTKKLAFLEEQEALAVDAAQKFALKEQIKEARKKVRALGGRSA